MKGNDRKHKGHLQDWTNYLLPMRPLFLLALASLGLPLFFSSCASQTGGFLLKQEQPQAAERIAFSDDQKVTVGLASLLNVEMELMGQCDSCHGASANFWEFEYDNKLDSMVQILWPDREILRLVPDVPPFTEADTLLDTLILRLAYWEGVAETICALDSSQNPLPTALPDEVKSWISSLHQLYKIDLLLLPGPTWVKLYPKNNTPHGEVEVQHLFSVWDLRSSQLLFRSCQQRRWKTSSGEQIDRQTTPPLLNPLLEQLLKWEKSR